MTTDPEQSQAERPVPPSAEGLQRLVELLYPEPGVVDILTLDQFIFRYKFSGLGATAVADMERAQRITRSVGDHGQIGLAEFHIGLIYLHWGQFLGAIKYFDDAQRHWQFAKQDPAVSLAQFAQGVCRHHAYHYENALANYGKVQRTLANIEANGSAPPPDFLADMKSVLKACRDDVVLKIRTLGEGEPTTFRVPIPEEEAPPPDVMNEPPTREMAGNDPEPASSPPPANTSSRLVPEPIIKLQTRASDSQMGATTTLDEADSLVPIILEKSPIPQHANESNHLVWYHVTDREDLESFLPDIQIETALLVDTRTDLYTCGEGDLVIVDQQDAEGSIPLKPQQETKGVPFTRIYLAEVDEEFSFTRNLETGIIEFDSEKNEEVGKVKITADQADFPIYAEEIIGIVIGIWSKLHPTLSRGEAIG